MTVAATLIDPATLARVKDLQLRARAVVEGFDKGLHRSPYHGFSAEFSEYRAYAPGDDTKYLDWHVFARSDRYYIKKFEDETNLRCHLVVDASRSMSYASGPITKWDYARTAAATIAYFLHRQRDAVGLVTFEEHVKDYLPPRVRPGHLGRLMALLDCIPQGKATDFAAPLAEAAAATPRRGLFVILSDLFVPSATVRQSVGDLRAAGHEVVVIRVLDPEEESFSFSTPAMFRDAETGQELFVDPKVIAAEYRTRFMTHATEVHRACIAVGADFESTTTSRPLELVLFDLLRARSRRGRLPGRTTSARGGAR